MTDLAFRIAAAQMSASDDVDANLGICRELAGRAADRGARLLALPENFAFLGRREADKFPIAEDLDAERPGPILATLMDVAKEHGMWVVAGGMAERIAGDSERTYNTCLVVSDTGELVATYRKIHLFDIDIAGQTVLRESDTTAPGTRAVVAQTPLAALGLTVCYDLRFPELYRSLTERGAQVVFVPAAFTAHTGAAHWHVLLRARAIENQLYVVAPGQVGRHNEKRHSYGHTLIIDPWGRILDEVAEGIGLAVADVDLDALARTRREMPCLSHRRSFQ
jgi:predicted amidohydrolase